MLTRVSCGALIRLNDADGRFALLGSRSKFADRGRRVLTPIGGAIETTSEGRRYLVDCLGVDDGSFESGNDLRFHLPSERLAEFRDWFLNGDGLEADPARREYAEELGPKEHAILSLDEIQQCNFEFCACYERVQPSTRWGQEGVMTHCFFNFYVARVSDAVMARLTEAAAREDNLLEFVTAAEIVQGSMQHGAEIPDLSRLLLDL